MYKENNRPRFGDRRGGDRRGGDRRGGDRRGFQKRELHDAKCSACGEETKVPFKPREDRPVYCRDCFAKKRDNNLTDDEMMKKEKKEKKGKKVEEETENEDVEDDFEDDSDDYDEE